MKLARGQDIGGRDATVKASEKLTDVGLDVVDCIISTAKRWVWFYVRNHTAKEVVIPR